MAAAMLATKDCGFSSEVLETEAAHKLRLCGIMINQVGKR